MTWTATGAWVSAHATTLAVNNQAVGNLLLVGVLNTSNNTVWCTGLSGGGATWTPFGVKFSISVFGFPEYATLFAGTVTATGAGTVTPSWSGTAPASYYLDGHEFHSSVGSWSLDVQGNLDSAGTTSWASLTPASSGELYFGFEDNAGSASGGTTSGYVYNLNPSGLGQAYNLSCPSGVATFPVWADTDGRAGIMVLVQETGGGGAASGRPLRGRIRHHHGARRQQQQAAFGVPGVDTLSPGQLFARGSRGPSAAESTRATYT